MSKNWKYITPPAESFAGLPVCTQLDELEADIAIIGLHYISPYPQRSPAVKDKAGAETAADAIRRQSARFIDHLDHYDFDFNDVLLAGRQVRMVDCGDVDKQPAGRMLDHLPPREGTIIHVSSIGIVISIGSLIIGSSSCSRSRTLDHLPPGSGTVPHHD